MPKQTLNLRERVPALLREHPEQRFTAKEIARIVRERYPDECAIKLETSAAIDTEAELLQQITAEIGGTRPIMQERFPSVKTTESRPRRYYWSDQSDADVADATSIEATDPDSELSLTPSDVAATGPTAEHGKLSEHDLYPRLGEYLRSELNVAAMRISESKGSNARGPGGNRWLYPDVVGMVDLTAGWMAELRDCVRESGDARASLWSFEVKLRLNGSNVRESYFQAVSNSSWANFGYLVAAEIEGQRTMQELRMLSALHGIGVIQLEAANPAESQILIPCRERPQVDWSTCDRLIRENSDFGRFIKRIRQFYLTSDQPTGWDLTPEPPRSRSAKRR